EVGLSFGGQQGKRWSNKIVRGNRVGLCFFRYHGLSSASNSKMYNLARDTGHAVRVLLRSPGYTAATLLSLGLGIGANTAIFTVTNATLLHSLPVTEPNRVLQVFTVDHATPTGGGLAARTPVSLPNIADIRKQNEVFRGVAAWFGAGVTLTG